jgi:25S rRNA (uracil2843-N3)-methyltransferase
MPQASTSLPAPTGRAPKEARKAKGRPRPAKPSSGSPPTVNPGEIDLLHLLRAFSSSVLSSPGLESSLQQIKSHLYSRIFDDAFQPSLQPFYVARWVPSRALAYRALFLELEQVRDLLHDGGSVLCVGGGAGSELVALYAAKHELATDQQRSPDPLDVVCMDLADWSTVFRSLSDHVAGVWPSQMSTGFLQADALSIDSLSTLNLSSFDLVTIMFTLAELFTSSRPRTLAFLNRLTHNCKPGTNLLIVDSASSYSDLAVGNSGNKYSTSMVVDHFLVGSSSWTKEGGEDSRWYRLVQGLEKHYPLQLEDARFFWRLYRRNRNP